MDSNNLKDSEDLDITEFSQNDNFFRSEICMGGIDNLNKIEFESIPNKLSYDLMTLDLPGVVMIDLGDVAKFLEVRDQPGFDPINIRRIADIVCDFLGDDSEFYEAIWTAHDENISSSISAQLGSSEEEALSSTPFEKAMDVTNAIANLVRNYLITANYPVIETSSIYKVGGYKNGIIALQLRDYSELKEEFGSEDLGPGDY